MSEDRTTRRIVVTGADGFVGRNFALRMTELGDEVLPLTRASTPHDWHAAVDGADAVVHLAGANRPSDPTEFETINAGTATLLATALDATGRSIPVLYASSTRASGDDDYGRSKRAGEDALRAYSTRSGSPVYIFRLPNVFGKWARPNYNSAVATFCHNIARDLPITVNDPAAPLSLVYIDDVVAAFVAVINERPVPGFVDVAPVYTTTVGAVADTIRGFRADRSDNLIDAVGTGLTRALYATYVAALPPAEFSYEIASHRDPRGAFSEMLKTRSAGQFSYFTALNGLAASHDVPVIVSTHPRTRKRLDLLEGVTLDQRVQYMKPFGFHDYNHLQMHARCAISDSGTIAEESSILNFPAITPRDAIERPEAMDTGNIIVTGLDPDAITSGVEAAIALHQDRRARGAAPVIPADYQIDNTSDRVIKLVLGLSRLSNGWDGIRLHDYI